LLPATYNGRKNKSSNSFLLLFVKYPIPWWDSISRPIPPVPSVQYVGHAARAKKFNIIVFRKLELPFLRGASDIFSVFWATEVAQKLRNRLSHRKDRARVGMSFDETRLEFILQVLLFACFPYSLGWMTAAVATSVDYLYVSRLLVSIQTSGESPDIR
jgi:hypothetical protein